MGQEVVAGSSTEVVTTGSTEQPISSQVQTPVAEAGVQQIDWSKIDPDSIPEDIVRKHKAAKELLDESVKRRKVIAELRDQLGKLEEKPADDKAKKKVEVAPSGDTPVPVWAQQMIDKITAIEMVAGKANHDALISQVMTKHGLPSEAKKFLAGDNLADLEASAFELAKLTVPDKLRQGSGYGNVEDATARASRILGERLNTGTSGIPKEGKFFDPAVHRNK